MKYIRFLKTPRIENHTITALIIITSDLGDFPLAREVQLYACLYSDADSRRKIAGQHFTWTPYSQGLRLTLNVAAVDSETWPARMYVGVQADIENLSDVAQDRHCGVMAAWSSALHPRRAAISANLVERRLAMTEGELKMWEETGESIARHVWDAGIVLAAHINAVCSLQKKPGQLALDRILSEHSERPLKVIELGSGTGVVGITIARLRPRWSVVLSDLEKARDIIERNMAVNAIADTSTSNISFTRLDWEDGLPDSVQIPFNVVVFADCTYNVDSHTVLVRTLGELLEYSPKALIVMATKTRHESEAGFLRLMADAGLTSDSHQTLQIPPDEDEEEIELFTFVKPP